MPHEKKNTTLALTNFGAIVRKKKKNFGAILLMFEIYTSDNKGSGSWLLEFIKKPRSTVNSVSYVKTSIKACIA